jgi:sulfite reductase (NADPH) flavoprotein alpha-component
VATDALVYKVARAVFGEAVQGIELTKINAHAWAGLQEVEVPTVPPQSISAPLKHFEFNAIAVETDEGDTIVNGARLSSWHDAAKHLMFPSVFSSPLDASPGVEEFPQNPALRPELPERTFLVTTAVNRRLTPNEYDRNVFHLEFDTTGTGLKYAIGEALGIHGWNDEQDVLDFCHWYGADPNKLITIPVVAGEGRLHTRTTLQALQQQIDLFGRPPKSFYSDLAAYATNAIDKFALLFIGSPEGSSTFKKLAEKDTVTFADVLQRYPSARPSIEILCEMVGDIKPRHYSIASAQSAVGDRVDLLVVSVDWVTPSGEWFCSVAHMTSR